MKKEVQTGTKKQTGGDMLTGRVMDFCGREGLLAPGNRIVAGISGGADSLCLLRMLCDMRKKMGIFVTAVHVHHGIRGREADEDLAYVRQLCSEWNVPLREFFVCIPELAKKLHLSEEEAGRQERYRIFEEVWNETGSDRIAVAHHMDDLAETVLMNMLRGSGVRGISGIPAKRGHIVRPLLCLRRGEIEAWLKERGIAWRTDSTNQEDAYFRNRVRNRLLPDLSMQYNEKAVEHIAQLAREMRRVDDYFTDMANGLLKPGGAEGGLHFPVQTELENPVQMREAILDILSEDGVRIPAVLLRSNPAVLAPYLVRCGLERLGTGLKDIGRTHIDALLELSQKDGCGILSLPGGVLAHAEYGDIFLQKVSNRQRSPGFCLNMRIFLWDKNKKVPQSGCINWFDYGKIKETVQLRNRAAGDMICVERSGRYKKLKDYLIDQKIPARVRDRWPVFAVQNRILWIPGCRMGEDFRVDEGTRLILQVQLKLQ